MRRIGLQSTGIAHVDVAQWYNFRMSRTVVGVLRGGTSSEYPHSLKTGAAMMAALPEERYETRDILIGKDGTWHLRGMPVDPARALQQIDVALNALHGGVGEDGTIHRILDRAGVPYPGSRAHPAGSALNKIRAREILRRADIQMPRAVSFSTSNNMNTRDMSDAVFALFGPPYMVKPSTEGSSHGLRVAETIIELPDVLADAMDEFGAVLVEEYVMGSHVTIGIIEEFRNEELYALPPAEVALPEASRYFDPEIEGEDVLHSVPTRLSHEVKVQIAELARRAHTALRLAHFSDADFVVSRSGRPHILEVNSLPGLHTRAAFPHMLEAVGSSVREFLEHSIALARR